MSTTTASEQILTFVSIDLALMHIYAALKRLQRNPDSLVDNQTAQAIEEARLLKPYLERNPTASTPEAFDCCCKLLEIPVA